MKKKEKIFDCTQCGNRFVVSETGEGHLSPLYCCGEELSEAGKGGTSGPGKKSVSRTSSARKKGRGRAPKK